VVGLYGRQRKRPYSPSFEQQLTEEYNMPGRIVWRPD
jgi:hypothetical protein